MEQIIDRQLNINREEWFKLAAPLEDQTGNQLHQTIDRTNLSNGEAAKPALGIRFLDKGNVNGCRNHTICIFQYP